MGTQYHYQLTNGKDLTLDGDTPPTDEEVESIAKEQGVTLAPAKESGQTKPDVTKPDVTPVPNAETPKSNETKPTENDEPKESFLGKVWDKVNEPLTDAPTRFAESVSHYINPNSETKGVRGLSSAFVEGLGHAVSGLTSPLNAGLAALTGGTSLASEAGLPEVAAGLRTASRVASAPVAAEGLAKVYNGNTLSDKLLGGLEAGTGLLGMRGGHLPEVADDIKGDVPTDVPSDMSPTKPTTINDVVPLGEESKLTQLSSNLVRIPELVDEGAPPIRQKTGNFWVDDANRMEDEALSRRSDPIQSQIAKDINEKWNNRANSSSIYEGRFNQPNTRQLEDNELTPEQLAIRKSYQNIQDHSDAHARKFSEEEDKLSDLIAAHDKLVNNYNNSDKLMDAMRPPISPKVSLPADDWTSQYKTNPSAPSEPIKEPVVTSLKEPTDELMAQARDKGPPSMILKNATPDLVRKAGMYGYKVSGLTEDGTGFRMVKTPVESAPPSKPPIIPEGLLPPELDEDPQQLDEPNKIKRNAIADAINFPKSVMASMNFHAPLRQALPMVANKAWWTSWNDMFKSWGSEDAFNQVQDSIKEDPAYDMATKAGIKFTNLGDLSNREESMQSKLAETIPGVRASNRAYTAFLNKTRMDAFKGLIDDARVLDPQTGEYNMKTVGDIANFVNIGTGRGSLGPLESSAVALNTALFSPRLIASRLQLMNPYYYVMASPIVRQEALKSLLAVAGAGTAFTQLGKLAGGTVSNDPTSNDFGKLKIGNTRLDPYAGFQQYVVAANKLIQGKATSTMTGKTTDLTSGKFGKETRADVAGNFAESKLNPPVAFALDLLRGKSSSGQPLNIPDSVAKMFVPIVLQDLKSITTDNPNLLPNYKNFSIDNVINNYKGFDPSKIPQAAPSMFGMNEQNYGSR